MKRKLHKLCAQEEAASGAAAANVAGSEASEYDAIAVASRTARWRAFSLTHALFLSLSLSLSSALAHAKEKSAPREQDQMRPPARPPARPSTPFPPPTHP